MLRLISILFFISSCSDSIIIPDNVNKILITYHIPNSSDSISFTEVNSEKIALFKEVFKQSPVKVTCNQTGTIDFISESKTVLHLGFSISPSCPCLIQDNKAWRLTYRAGMYLDYNISKQFKNKK